MSAWSGRGLVWTMVLAMAAVATAQPLAERVPAGVEAYIGWKGADALRGPYEGTHLQGVIAASQLPAAFDQTWPKVIARIEQEDARSAETLRRATEIARLAWRHPAAIYGSWRGQRLRAAIIVQAGAEADALVERFGAMAAAGRPGVPVKAFRLDDLAVLAIGYEQDQMALAGAGAGRPQPLSTDARFTSTMAQVQKDAAIVYYGDFAAAHKQLAAAPTTAPAGGTASVRHGPMHVIARVLGSVDSLAWTGSFDGKQWRTQTFIAAPAPRSGLATLLEAQPLSDDLLRAIPRDADWLAVRRLDLDKLHREARAAAESLGPDVLRGFDQVMGAATVGLGTNLQQNLFEPLGDEWAVYIAPRSVGAGFMSAVVINRVNDPAKVNRALASIAIATSNVFSNAMRRKGMSLQLRTLDHRGTRISYLPVPAVTPAWAIRGNLLYMGLYPQTVAGALDAAAAGSILDSETFQAARRQLPDRSITSVSFANLPATAEQSYVALLMLAQSYMGLADLFGADGQPLLLPTLADLRPHLAASARVAWVDDAGWHAQTIQPFPMSDMLAGEFSAVASQYPVLLGVLVPSLARRPVPAPDAIEPKIVEPR